MHFCLTTYRRKHIETQFFNGPEFLLHFIEAKTDKIGAVGLWKSIVKIIKHALENTFLMM